MKPHDIQLVYEEYTHCRLRFCLPDSLEKEKKKKISTQIKVRNVGARVI